jgi:hypothetical protein
MTIYKMTPEVLEEPKGQSWMDVGIHNNVELVEVVTSVSKNGNPFIAFYFENERGERASKTEWEVNSEKSMEEMDEKEKATYLSRIKNQMTRISNIAKQYLDKHELLFEATDFKSYIEAIKQKLDGKFKGVKLRIKIVYDYNDWATLPSSVTQTWIERMDLVPTEKSKIKIIDGKDKMVKSGSRPDTFLKEDNPLDPDNTGIASASTSNTSSGLPF